MAGLRMRMLLQTATPYQNELTANPYSHELKGRSQRHRKDVAFVRPGRILQVIKKLSVQSRSLALGKPARGKALNCLNNKDKQVNMSRKPKVQDDTRMFYAP